MNESEMMWIERRVEAEEARMLYTHTAYDGGERTLVSTWKQARDTFSDGSRDTRARVAQEGMYPECFCFRPRRWKHVAAIHPDVV